MREEQTTKENAKISLQLSSVYQPIVQNHWINCKKVFEIISGAALAILTNNLNVQEADYIDLIEAANTDILDVDEQLIVYIDEANELFDN